MILVLYFLYENIYFGVRFIYYKNFSYLIYIIKLKLLN